MAQSLITVGIACPFPLFRAGLRAALHATEDIRIVAETGDAAIASVLFRKAQPMAVLLDPLLYAEGPDTLAAYCDDEDAPTCLAITIPSRHTAAAPLPVCFTSILTYADGPEDYIRALRRGVAGRRYVSATVSTEYASLARGNAGVKPSTPVRFTATEKKVIERLIEGKTSREIAEELFISYRTVQKHRSNIVAKLGLRGSNALFAWALRQHGKEKYV
jgi:DNA-binding NarL/FixJ family response regulator